MGFFKKSPTTGADSIASTIPATLYLWGSNALVTYVLFSTVYSLLGREYDQIFTSPTIMCLACLHCVLLILTSVSYLRTRFTNPGYIPRPHRFSKSEIRALEGEKWGRALEEGNMVIVAPDEHDLRIREFMVCEPNGVPMYCTTCRIFRPERTSHCAQKGRCVVKLDHYCPLLSSAIGIGNYKYYINCLSHSLLLIIYLFAMGITAVIKVGPNGWTITILTLSTHMFLFVSFVFWGHIYLILNNITTRDNDVYHQLSNYETQFPERQRLFVRCNVTTFWENYGLCAPMAEMAALPPIVVELDLRSKPWTRSYWENWTGVMGEKWWRWFLPLSPKLEKKIWWACEFNERTQNLLRTKGKEILQEIVEAKQAELDEIMDKDTQVE